MKTFLESLYSAFTFDPEYGNFFYQFGSANEYELSIEPLLSGQFHLALYHHRNLVWSEKLPVKPGYTIPEGLGVEQEQRRKEMKDVLLGWLAELEIAEIRPIKEKNHD